jgi:hypothetical protein
MKIIELQITRVFGLARFEYRGRGKFTRFGFEGNNETTLEAEIEGHPDLPLGVGSRVIMSPFEAGRYSKPGT